MSSKNLTLSLFAVFFLFFCEKTGNCVPLGDYEVADFSSYGRGLTLGSNVTEDKISMDGGLGLLRLSGDNGFIKTNSDLPGFTYQSDWSWMTIIKTGPTPNPRIFMRGKAWYDKIGDFDLRMGKTEVGETVIHTWHRSPGWVDSSAVHGIDDSELVYLAGTYSYFEGLSRLYVNGVKVGQYYISPMDDSNNDNPLAINGQWAENARDVGNVYGEGEFEIAQLILQQDLYSEASLLNACNLGLPFTHK